MPMAWIPCSFCSRFLEMSDTSVTCPSRSRYTGGSAHQHISMSWIFIIHLFLTLYMTGVIWFVQLVHYPLMGKIGEEAFLEYELHHQNRMFWVVGIQMVIELVTGIWLLLQQSYNPLQWWNVLLLLVIWASTFFIQSPLHNKLGNGYRVEWQQKLVDTNWVRTVAWTLRSLILCSMLV